MSVVVIIIDVQRNAPTNDQLDHGVIPVEELHKLLDGFTVQPEYGVGYNRENFRHWINSDGDCFNTRHQVLRQESLSNVQVDVGTQCMVRAGDWVSIYDGRAVTDPADLDIDHLVPLAEAWDSGAWAWSDTQRQAFANDLEHDNALIAVTKESNRSKGRGDPADWLPPDRSVHCWYAQAWIEVKARWNLDVDQFELRALRSLLDACL